MGRRRRPGVGGGLCRRGRAGRVYVEDRRAPVDIEGVLAARRLATEPTPPGPFAARLVWMEPTRAATGVDGIARDEVRALLRKLDVAVVLAALGWAARPPAAVKRDPGLSILLVSVDTLRPDALGCYGRAGAATPWIDRLAALGPLLAPILEAGAASRTLVVFTSDHGESLGEHGETTHGVFAYESTLRVPLVVWAPGLFAPGVVRTPVRHVDVLPTLLDAVGLAPPPGLSGRSLLPVIAGRGGPEPDSYLEALSSSLNRGWAPLHGAIHGGLKYVDLPVPELYDLRAGPREARSLAAARPGEVERMHALLAGLRRDDVGVDSRVREEEADLRPLDAESVSLHAVYLIEAGRAAEALALLEPYAKNVTPDIDVLTALGMAKARTGHRVEALATFARARELDPSNAMVLVNAGTVYLMAGDHTRAWQAFETALDLDDGLARAHNSLGVLSLGATPAADGAGGRGPPSTSSRTYAPPRSPSRRATSGGCGSGSGGRRG